MFIPIRNFNNKTNFCKIHFSSCICRLPVHNWSHFTNCVVYLYSFQVIVPTNTNNSHFLYKINLKFEILSVHLKWLVGDIVRTPDSNFLIKNWHQFIYHVLMCCKTLFNELIDCRVRYGSHEMFWKRNSKLSLNCLG